MKKFFSAGVAAIALAAATFPATGAFAATIATGDYTGNPITLRRTITNVTNPVNNTFDYTIAKSTTPTGGDVTGFPTSASIAFNNAAPTSGSVQASTTVSFVSANFTKVGDYEFTITESGSSDVSNYPIDTTNNSYKALVQVRYYVDSNTGIPDNSRYTGYAVIYNKSNAKVSEATWTSGSSYTYIQATAKTTGNLGETDECFAYTIDIDNATFSGTYAIDINPTTNPCANSATTVTAGTPATVYLKNGDTVRVGYNGGTYQLPVGVEYTITDINGSDGYTTKMDNATKDSVIKTTVASDAPTFGTANTTAIENNKNQDPVTGIVTNFWFYIMLLVAGIIGFFIISRRKQEDEQQQ